MGWLAEYRANRLVERLLSLEAGDDARASQFLAKLKPVAATAVPEILRGMANPGPGQRAFLIGILSRLLDNDTLPAYFAGLRDANPKVVAATVEVLKASNRCDPNQLIELFEDLQVSKPAVIDVLFHHRDRLDSHALLRAAFRFDQNNCATIFRLLQAKTDPALIPELVNRLSARQPEIRRMLVQTLAQYRNDQVVGHLQSMLQDPDKSVRKEALKGLGMANAPLDVGELCELLRDADMAIQSQAIDAIVQLNDPQTVDHLLGILEDEQEYVRRAAVEVLNAIADTDAIKDLLVAIKDRDWWVRERAADALTKIGGPKVVDAMLELIQDDDQFVRRTAIEVINAHMDERAYDHLIRAIHDTDWWVRERAMDALGSLRDERAVPHLLELLESEPASRAIVIRTLGAIGSPRAIPHLVRRLEDTETTVKREVLQALPKLVDERTAPSIKRAITGRTGQAKDSVKEWAAQALAEIEASLTAATAAPDGDGEPAQVVAAADADVHINPAMLEAGEVLAQRYRVIRRIGKGAFGTVVLVEDKEVGEQIVLKFINPQLAEDETAIKRFVHELRYTRRITHENVVRIYDFLRIGNSAAISMEYLKGHSLNEEMRPRKPLPQPRALGIIRQVAKGMASAHQHDIIHRDLKPANILIGEADLVKVVDFGIASMTRGHDTQLTKTGLLVGTPIYMSPEQIMGKTLDNRTDIYSLGIILYEVLAGQPPYQGNDHMALIYHHLNGDAKPLHEVNPEISKTLSAVVHKTMAVTPDDRYQSMAALGERLDLLLT